MDPFTQRMLERARARQEKIDQKLANSGLPESRRKPLSENVNLTKSPAKSPCKISTDAVLSPKKSSRESLTPKKVNSPRRVSQDKTASPLKSNRRSIQKTDSVSSPQRVRNDVIVTRKEFNSPRKVGENRRNSDVSVEINIMHRDDIQIEVQVEEHDVPMTVIYDTDSASNVTVKEIEDSRKMIEDVPDTTDRTEKTGLRHNMKSRLDRLGNLYSDEPTLSSPIHRTEAEFTSATPPQHRPQRPPQPQEKPRGARKFGRLAALADEINNWEDDLTQHSNTAPTDPKQKSSKPATSDALESSTLDVSIHSIKDINSVLSGTAKASTKSSKPQSHTFTRPTNECQRLQRQIVAELESEGYRRVSASQSRLVYDFTRTTEPDRQEPRRVQGTLSAAATPAMATVVAGPANPPAIAKKPSIKKYKAPTPPKIDSDESCESDKDKENNVVPREVNDNDCVQTASEEKPAPGSPAARRVHKVNGHADRGSVLSKAAMFEAGSPRAKEKDPAEMSLRERKALFEKNKGAAIIPKAPFGLAPSTKTLHGDNKVEKPAKPVVQTVVSNSKLNGTKEVSTSKQSLQEDNVSQSSLGGGIKGKLAALFNKEQTISETTIANKFKQERDREMEMLQNRYQYKPKPDPATDNASEDDHSEAEDPSEHAPLMGSTTNIYQNKKPEIIANIPKVDKTKSETNLDGKEQLDDGKVGSQPIKRRSSQDSPVVLSVLEDVKRIKVNNGKKEQTNGAITHQPALYPHLSDIETDNSNTQEEYSDCGGSSQDDEVRPNLNKSDNWADTSFGREVMSVVKRNNSSYQKAVRESDSDESGACDSELDDMLDEALNEDEGPTPPKLNKATLSSNSFVYEQKKFKSPLKCQPSTPATPKIADKGSELVHSVSFYRKTQNSSTPSSGVRVIRRESPEQTAPETAPAVTTVRRRIRELQAEIAKQQTVISQASQALNLCASTIEFSGSTEQAEGERLLLLATHRRQACLHEVQRLQVEGAGVAAHEGIAALHVVALRVPLTRDYTRRLNAEGAVGHHAVCLVKCRDRVLASSMQLTSPKDNVLHFPDQIHMDGLTSDFKVTIEVYLLQASKEILPHDVKYHIFSKKSNSKMLTPKSKGKSNPELKTPRVQSPAGPLSVRSPQFQLHGYCIFALPQANRKNFTLNKVPAGSPLDGTISLDISASLRVPPPAPHAAFLTAFDDVSGLGAWHRRWFQLRAARLQYWKYPDDVQKKYSNTSDVSGLGAWHRRWFQLRAARLQYWKYPDDVQKKVRWMTLQYSNASDVSGLGAWHRRWFQLRAARLQYWKYPDDVQKKMPIGDIDLSTVISDKVLKAPRDLCARPNTILLECSVPAGLIVPDTGSLVYVKTADGSVARRHLLAADTASDRDVWLDILNKALEYVRCTHTEDDE